MQQLTVESMVTWDWIRLVPVTLGFLCIFSDGLTNTILKIRLIVGGGRFFNNIIYTSSIVASANNESNEIIKILYFTFLTFPAPITSSVRTNFLFIKVLPLTSKTFIDYLMSGATCK